MSLPRESIKSLATSANQYVQNLVYKYANGVVDIRTDVTDHLIVRADERGVSHSLIARITGTLFRDRLCELIFCMETKDLTYLIWESNLHTLIIPCRTFKRDDGSYSLAFTSIFEGKCKIRDEYHNIIMGA